MEKIIYSVTDIKDWIEIAYSLKEQLDWIPVYWLSPINLKSEVKKKFSDVIFHNCINSYKGIRSNDVNFEIDTILDKELLNKYSKYESIVLKMMDRMDTGFGSFLFNERMKLYFKLLSYWETIIKKLKPDLAIFSTSPHIISDYILYIVCKENNIRTLIFTPTIENNIFLREDIDLLPEHIINNYKENLKRNNQTKLSGDLRDYLNKIKKDYGSAEPWYMSSQREKEKIKIVSIIKKILKVLINPRKLFEDDPKNYIKLKNKQVEKFHMSKIQAFFYSNISNLYKKHLKKIYDSKSTKVEFKNKYIFFPLHYQPERTTSPEGNIFVYQWLVINMISKLLPKDWNIYVKEHPSQFKKALKGQQGRASYFYDQVLEFDNVKLVDLDIDTFDLIDNSEAVVTITGTAGFESLVRGKPVILYGNSWYSGCKGVFKVTTKNQCINAINKIKSKVNINNSDIDKYIDTIMSYSFKGYLDNVNKKRTQISSRKNIDNIINNLIEYMF
ncbi:MAG: hypothetical protein ACOCUI_04310 [bacterium]